MGVGPVSPPDPSGGTSSTTAASGTSGTGASGTGVVTSGEIARLLSTLSSVVSSLEPNANSPDQSKDGGPDLPTPQNVPLNLVLSTINTMRANFSQAIQQQALSDVGVLQALFLQYFTANPGALTAAIQASASSNNTPAEQAAFLAQLVAGTLVTSTVNQPALISLLNNFESWLKTLNTQQTGVLPNTLRIALRLLPDTTTPSTSQDFSDTSGASGSGALALTVGTQTQTGAAYFRQIISALYNELMQNTILTGAGSTQPLPKPGNVTPGAQTPDDQTLNELQEAVTGLITYVSALSSKAALSLLKDANIATLKNPQVADLTQSVAVLATFSNLLSPGSNQTLNGLANAAGLNLSQLAPHAQVSANLAQFLQQTLITSGLTAFFQALKQLLLQKLPQEEVKDQVDNLNNRDTELGQALNGKPITSKTLSGTLAKFQTLIAGNPNYQAALTTALTGLFQSSLKRGGALDNQTAQLAPTLSQQVIGLFSQNTPVTANQIQNLIAQQTGLTSEQQSGLTNQVLTLAASVATQQEIQTDFIRGGAATAASGFSAQTSQVLYGVSVNLLTGEVAQGNTPSVTQLAAAGTGPSAPIGAESPIGPQGSFNWSKDVNTDLGTYLLKLMQPASVILELAGMTGGPESSIAGDRNLPQSRGP